MDGILTLGEDDIGNYVCFSFAFAKRLSQALVHLVTARASLFTDHKISGLPIRAKNKHFRTIVSKLLTILPRISILLS